MRWIDKSKTLRWFIVIIAIMESGDETRVVCIRDTCGNAVQQQNRAMSIPVSDSLHCVFCQAEAHENHPKYRGGRDLGSVAA